MNKKSTGKAFLLGLQLQLKESSSDIAGDPAGAH
jgi:hypothetical protein